MKILFALTHYTPYIGGAEESFRRLAEGLAARGHQVLVVTTRLPGTCSYEKRNQVEIYRVDIPRFAYQFLFTFYSFWLIFRLAQDCDLIHASSNYSALVAFGVARLRRKPILFTCHEVLGKRWRYIQRSLMAYLYRMVEFVVVRLPYDRYVAVSNATRADLLDAGIDGQRVSVILWGLDALFSQPHIYPEGRLRRRLGIAEDDFIYTYYGRPGMTKGVGYLLTAVPAVLAAIPNSHLVLVLAQEPYPRYLAFRRLVKEMALEQHVHFVDPFPDRDELAHHLVDSNCIVIPSVTEGFGLTTVEACELGIPVVATAVGPIPDLVFGRYILVAPRSREALADGVIRMSRGEGYLRAKRTDLTWEQVILSYEDLYKDLLK